MNLCGCRVKKVRLNSQMPDGSGIVSDNQLYLLKAEDG